MLHQHVSNGTQIVTQVEADLLNIIQGGAPAGYEYLDVEEEYVVDAKTGSGSWQLAKPPPVVAPVATSGPALAVAGGVPSVHKDGAVSILGSGTGTDAVSGEKSSGK